MISRIGPARKQGYEEALRALGEGAMVDLVRELERGGEVTLLTAMEVDAALGHLWPRLTSYTNSSEPF